VPNSPKFSDILRKMARYKSAGTICWSELRGRHSGDTEITQTPLDIGCSMGTPHWAAFLDDRCAQVGQLMLRFAQFFVLIVAMIWVVELTRCYWLKRRSEKDKS
jgi:hypothetical protein